MAKKENWSKNMKRKANADRVRHGVADNPVAHDVQRLYERNAMLLIAEGVLLAFVGGVMLWRPVELLTLVTFVLGGILILFGLYRVISGFVVSRGVWGGWLDVLVGLIYIVIGVLFCAYPLGSVIGVVYLFVVLFLFKALRTLFFAINMARVRFGHYVFNLVVSIVLVVASVSLLFWPVAGAVALVVYMAITLIMYAVADVYMFFELRRLRRLVTN